MHLQVQAQLSVSSEESTSEPGASTSVLSDQVKKLPVPRVFDADGNGGTMSTFYDHLAALVRKLDDLSQMLTSSAVARCHASNKHICACPVRSCWCQSHTP